MFWRGEGASSVSKRITMQKHCRGAVAATPFARQQRAFPSEGKAFGGTTSSGFASLNHLPLKGKALAPLQDIGAGAGYSTLTLTLALTPLLATAKIVHFPFAFAVTFPSLLTVAIFRLSLNQRINLH